MPKHFNAALRNTINRVAIRHTASAESRLKEAHKLLGISHKYIEQVSEMFNSLATKKITDEQVLSLIADVFKSGKKEQGGEEDLEESTRIKNIREAVFQSYQDGIGQSSILGTAWGAYNGITHYLGHVKSYKTGDVKFDSLMDGSSAKLANEGFQKLILL